MIGTNLNTGITYGGRSDKMNISQKAVDNGLYLKDLYHLPALI